MPLEVSEKYTSNVINELLRRTVSRSGSLLPYLPTPIKVHKLRWNSGTEKNDDMHAEQIVPDTNKDLPRGFVL